MKHCRFVIRKSPNTEFFLIHILSYSVQIRQNTDLKKLHIGTLFTQWSVSRSRIQWDKGCSCKNGSLHRTKSDGKKCKSKCNIILNVTYKIWGVTELLGNVEKTASDYKSIRCLIRSPLHLVSNYQIQFLLIFFEGL